MIIEVDKLYIVSGMGVMKAVELFPDTGVVLMLNHGNTNHWTHQASILRDATWEDVAYYRGQAEARGVACKNSLCWCKKDRIP